jgi:pyrroloquinoline-quinone synthase
MECELCRDLNMSDKTSKSRAPNITRRANEILTRVGISENPYFGRLDSGGMSLEHFRATQEQFFFAVTFFSRPMAALVGRIEDPQARIEILHNLVEEHGEFDVSAFHHNTFKKFLSSIGAGAQNLDALPVSPVLRAFNAVLTASCVLDEIEVGVGCMGIIEHAFSAISARIGQAVVRRGWVTDGELVHYKLHAKIDERHAEEFFAVVESRWSDPSRRYYIEQGLELGAYVFDRLYRDLDQLVLRSVPA